MRITPLEIKQKVFEKAFRGYDKDEVGAFLNSLSTEWERVSDLCKELQYKLEVAQEEVKKLREVENSLFKTLRTAEDTGANIIEQATKTAELHTREAEMKADALISEARSQAKSIIEEAETRSRNIVEGMEEELRELEQQFRNLDGDKVSLMSALKILADDILGKISRYEQTPVNSKPHLKKGKALSNQVKSGITSRTIEDKPKATEADVDKSIDDVEKPSKEDIKTKEKGSFFDQFEENE